MAQFPLFIELNQRKCLVVGGGNVAARKAKVLMEAGAVVEVVSKSFSEAFESLTKCQLIQEEVEISKFTSWQDYFMVIAATDDKQLNHRIASWCLDKGIFINSATSKEDSNFIFPAVIKKEGMTIGVSSAGKSPAVTRLIRSRMEQCIPDHLEEILEQLEQARELVKSRVEEQGVRKIIFYELIKIGIEQQKEITEAVVTEVISKVKREYENDN